jgi:predicted outer membrane repeat protein
MAGGKIPANTTFALEAALPPGTGPGPVILDGQGTNRAVTVNLDTAAAARTLTLDGLQIRNGFGNGSGGGILFASGGAERLTVNILNCAITNNVATSSGGGIYASQYASGARMEMVVSNSVVSHNEAVAGSGGGIRLQAYYGSLTVRDSTFAHNVTTNGSSQSGGAIYFDGGYYMVGGQLSAENSRFVGNIGRSNGQTVNASVGGGAIYRNSGPVTLRNCLLAGNKGYFGGAVFAMRFNGYEYRFENCTLADNESNGNVIHFRDIGGTAGITFHVNNAIFHGGTTALFTGTTGSGSPRAGSDLLIDHCCLPVDYAGTTTAAGDLVAGTGNITQPPQFLDQAGGDYRLAAGSPCINTGTNRAWMAGALDLDGNPRVDGVYRTVDMGAYEYVYAGTYLLIR